MKCIDRAPCRFNKIVAGYMQQAVRQHGTVLCGLPKAVAVQPRRIRRVMFQKALPQRVSHGRGGWRKIGLNAASLVDGIDRNNEQAAHA